jgi:mannose-6-phosphate isomerase
MELVCAVQKYEWGKIGLDSAVASLAKDGYPDFDLDPAAPYAELWMGTHPNGPSKLKCGKSLKDYLDEKPEALGAPTRQAFGDQLPFLFKVLSVNKALSIQAHPDKKLAEQLHAQRPDLYKDDNHKPEMLIALTDFEALCDFRPLSVIRGHLRDVPQLARCVGDGWEAMTLQECFTALMKCDASVVREQLTDLKSEISAAPADDRSFLSGLFLRLHEAYPGDVGCFVIYFLSYHKLAPGEALFLEANVPHAYLVRFSKQLPGANPKNLEFTTTTPAL